jgi:molecular chaperone GrpE
MSKEDAEGAESTPESDDPADGANEAADETSSGVDSGSEATAADADGEASDAPDADEAQSTTAADSVPDDLAAQVSEYDEELGAAVEQLESRVETLESELSDREAKIDDLTGRLKRKQADFQNYKKRAEKRREQLQERATEDLVERIVTVRDNLVRALEQDADADIRPGIESTLTEFDRILADENVSPIEPAPGEDVDPHRHEVMMRVEGDQPAGTVVDVYQPGYEMGEKVIRPAQVTVSDDE